MNCARCLLLPIVLCWFWMSPAAGDDTPKPSSRGAPENESESFESLFGIDVTGRPNIVKQDGTKIYIWRDGNTWSLRTNTVNTKKNRRMRFSGTIQVENGRVTSLQSIGGLEAKGKERDTGWLSPERKSLKFEFLTTGIGHDGIDFQVSDSATSLRFDLRIGGYDNPKFVVLGAEKHPAPSGKFVLSVPKSDK